MSNKTPFKNPHTWVNAVLIALLSSLFIAPSWAGSFKLNLKNTDIHSLIATVSKVTGKNFVVDPRVKAKVTVISSHDMDGDELYKVFLSVLQVHGYAAVRSGKVIKIVPETNAKQGPVPQLHRGMGGDELVTQVIALENVPAAQLVPILRPLVPQQGHLAAYPSTNMLIITDRAGNINRLTQIIKRIDRPDNEEVELIHLQHASASEVVRILGTLQQSANKGGIQRKGHARLAADERTNSVLISGDKANRLRIRGLIAHLDTPLESEGNTRVIYLRYANAKDLAAILKGVSAGQARTASSAVKGKTTASNGRSDIDIQADEHTNSLIITAAPNEMRSLQGVIRQLDIRRAQVLIEAIITEISEDKNRELGIQLAGGNSNNNQPLGFTNFGGDSSLTGLVASGGTSAVGLAGLTFGFGSATGSVLDFVGLVRALASDANNNILSTPSLVTLDNQEAEIIVGENVPFVTGQYTSAAGATAGTTNPFQTIERQDIGLTLRVKPQINEGNTIKMEIDQEISNVKSSSQSSTDITTTKRSIKTTVMVEDGQTIVLGGLISDTLRDTNEKVPLLGDIPLLGRLFQYRKTATVKQNLMVFIHPTILRDAATENHHTSRKYSFLRAQQLQAREEGDSLMSSDVPLLPELELSFTPKRNSAIAP
ncbi:MAG: type II secretion system secretin GspD [Gammaproteobacteria bacterium]|nr:type II secretion system secretin GspD [Gammaproteobacteria bacterium]